MRAAYYDVNGPAAEVLEVGEVETPQPGPGEVLVRLAVSGVNPSDVKARAGTTRKIAFPRVIPHSDGAGVIEAVGPGVGEARVGERVWIWNGQWRRAFGTAAEYIAVPEAQAVRLSDSTSFEVGACLGIPALTGWRAADAAGAAEGTTVLVAGGAGAVSRYAIQFAKWRKARVITTVSSEEKAAIARSVGADETIDYRREDVGARVRDLTEGRGADAVIELDLAANAHLIPATLRPKGTVVVYGTQAEARLPAQALLVNSIALQFIFVYELDAPVRDRAIADIALLLAADRLSHGIGAVLPLEEIVAAHEAVERGADGKVLVSLA